MSHSRGGGGTAFFFTHSVHLRGPGLRSPAGEERASAAAGVGASALEVAAEAAAAAAGRVGEREGAAGTGAQAG